MRYVRRNPQPLAALASALIALLGAPAEADDKALFNGAWLLDESAAVSFVACGDRLCGRIVWLKHAKAQGGETACDTKNPDGMLVGRALCGMTVLSGLIAADTGTWTNGRFYNPNDGETYDVFLNLVSSDELSARIYIGSSIIGQTKTLRRVAHDSATGWC